MSMDIFCENNFPREGNPKIHHFFIGLKNEIVHFASLEIAKERGNLLEKQQKLLNFSTWLERQEEESLNQFINFADKSIDIEYMKLKVAQAQNTEVNP